MTGCELRRATRYNIICSIGYPNQFFIDSPTLARDDLRRALRNCTESSFDFDKENDPAKCRADVTGVVAKNTWDELEITNGSLKWE